MFLNSSTKTIIIFLLTSTLLSLLFFKMVIRRAVVDLELKTEAKTTLKIYWTVGDQGYSEHNMAYLSIVPGTESYSFRICNIGKIDRLRIDTSDEKISEVTLKKMSINQNGYKPIVFSDISTFNNLTVIRGIEKITNDEKGLTITPADKDPQLEYRLPLSSIAYSPEYIDNSVRVLAIFLVVGFLFWVTRIFWNGNEHIPYLLFFVLALIITMASISKNNRHPDEYVHIYAAEYYQNHLLPPQVGSPEIRHTYSQYGVTRLDSGEVAYFFAGKFLKLLSPLNLPSYLSLRFFNVLLFSVLVFLALYKLSIRLVLLPVLMSSQIWYIFSYFNSDAFGLFLSLLAAYQLVVENSMFNKILQQGFRGRNIVFCLGIGSLFGLMLLTKMNFYFFIVFCFLYLVWKIVFKEILITKKLTFRILVIVFTGVMVAGIFKGGDIYVNGFDKGAKIQKYCEEFASPMYKPSTPLSKKHPSLSLKERGKTLKSLFVQNNWGEKSFASSFGVFGYTSVLASFIYYDIVRFIGGAFLVLIILMTILKGGLKGNTLLLITLFCSFSLIGMALNRSWVDDFQAQGRYFLPIVAMVSVLIHHIYYYQKFFIKSAFNILFVGMFLLSVYNYIFVGLYGIEKYSF
jgi:hypothetical protein